MTVNAAALLLPLAERTTTLAEPAASCGTLTAIELFDHPVTTAVLPPNVTVLEPCVAPKLAPEMDTALPGSPLGGAIELMLGIATGGGVGGGGAGGGGDMPPNGN